MDYEAHIASVERETQAFLEVLATTALDARVPTCPAWSLRDLTEHAGGFMGFWAHVLCEGAGVEKTPAPDAPDGPLTEWFDDLCRHLIERLRATSPTAEVWTWAKQDSSAAFVARRSAHELAVHRFDAESAAGRPRPIAADLAADGIDEIFFMIDNWHTSARDRRGTASGNGETIRLHATDTGDDWTVSLTDHVAVTRDGGDADLTLTGAVSDLELVLYQRPPIGPVERAGDDAAVDVWYQAFTFG
ncbi:MAG TPA: maleylpyruvate isomerase family mycothiol-dependent enzyme [Acidimicrobiales bacterium]